MSDILKIPLQLNEIEGQAFTGKMAFSGQIWAHTAHPAHMTGSIFTFSASR
jgi:hypothetical protein